MNKKLFFALTLLFISIHSANASIVMWEDVNPIYISNGNGFLSSSEEHNVYTIVNGTNTYASGTLGRDGDSISIIDYYNGVQYNNIIVEADTGVKIYCAVVASDGYLYYATNYGLYKRTDTYTTPCYTDYVTTDESTPNRVELLGTYDKIEAMTSEDGYLYFTDFDDKTMYRLNLDTKLVSTYMDFSSYSHLNFNQDYGRLGFDVYNGDIYWLSGYPVSYVTVYKNLDDTVLFQFDPDFTGSYSGGGLCMVDSDKMYIGHSCYSGSGGIGCQDSYILENVNGTWTETSVWAIPYIYMWPPYCNDALFYLGSKDNTIGSLAATGDFQIVATLDTGRSFSTDYSSSDDDSSSSTDNPLLSLDSPEDAKEFAINYSGLTWILLIFLFLMAAMGGRK